MQIHLLTFAIREGADDMFDLAHDLYRVNRLHYIFDGRGYPHACAMHFPTPEAAHAWADLHEAEIFETRVVSLDMQGA